MVNVKFHRKVSHCLLLVLALFAAVLNAQTPNWASAQAEGPHIQVSLLSEQASVSSGTLWLGVLFQPDTDWHTYWRNPGDSGEAPSLNWTLPDGVTVGDIQWPVPSLIPVAHLMNYGYDGENLLLVPLNVSEDYAQNHKTLPISVDLSWLVCKEDCIPGWATLSLTLPLSTSASPSPQATRFADTRSALPSAATFAARHESTDSHWVVSVPELLDGDWYLLPFASGIVEHAADTQITRHTNSTTFVLKKSPYASEVPDRLDFLLTDGDSGKYLTSRYNPPAFDAGPSMLILLLMAFAGGVLLNLMPCVLPVLAIKALALQQSSASNRNAIAYPAGILVSFWVFAALVVVMRMGGDAVGWGFHMQAPWFVALLAFLFVFIAMMLLDAAPQGNRLTSVGQSWLNGSGAGNQFFTGVLAVVVATPCTAPFMAAAMGVALSRDAATTFMLFSALGLGLAAPLTLIHLAPSLTRWMPKPGNWMVRFRQFLAFPMLLTVAWLSWVYLGQTSATAQFVLLTSLIIFALGTWLLTFQRSRLRLLTLVLLLASVIVPTTFISPRSTSTSTPTAQAQPFNQQRLSELRQSNQVVLVNMTADWCITCKVNEQVALQSDALQSLLSRSDIHYLVGDWTNKNPEILEYLNQYGRAGVPLYVVYPGQHPPEVLPQILTADRVTTAIQTAIGETQHAD